MASLVDTNILVYRFDPRFPQKQQIATEVLRGGLRDGSVRIPYQALIEFVAAVTRTHTTRPPILPLVDARREAEEFLTQFLVVYPNDAVFRTAVRGAAAYQLSWFDANLWAYAEYYGIAEIISEDFEPGRLYGSVRVRNPFVS